MWFFVVSSLLLIMTSSAFAEWTLTSKSSGLETYQDKSTISQTPTGVSVTELYSYKNPKKAMEIDYISAKYISEYDCKNRKTRVLMVKAYSEPMAKGKEVFSNAPEDNWIAVENRDMLEDQLNMMCK